jgi:hypothetical protein
MGRFLSIFEYSPNLDNAQSFPLKRNPFLLKVREFLISIETCLRLSQRLNQHRTAKVRAFVDFAIDALTGAAAVK